MEMTILVRVAPDGEVVATKTMNGQAVELTSLDYLTIADELRTTGIQRREQEQLAQVEPGKLYYYRGKNPGYVVSVAYASGIQFRKADKQGTILSPRPFYVFPVANLMLVKNQPALTAFAALPA